ncbi:peptidase inhibitor family I36 protein [Streptomyces sp. NPDC000618]|uniref:peptidase inhibitor family I36 protein n=1 Tax=Streptomyces sp. NPDC000618 TaxID=3154265 RepID=UPI00332152D0
MRSPLSRINRTLEVTVFDSRKTVAVLALVAALLPLAACSSGESGKSHHDAEEAPSRISPAPIRSEISFLLADPTPTPSGRGSTLAPGATNGPVSTAQTDNQPGKPSRTCPREVLCFYTDADFKGGFMFVKPPASERDFRTSRQPELHDSISSVINNSGVELSLFSDILFGGQEKKLPRFTQVSNLADFGFNDVISSYQAVAVAGS